MLARRLEKPRKTGERSSIRVRETKSEKELAPANVGKSRDIMYGVAIKAMMPAIATKQKKNEKMPSINSLASSSLFSNRSIKNGIRTEIETTDATVTNKISGMRKAA